MGQGEGENVRLFGHLGMEDLAMVVHALNVLVVLLLLLLERGVDVLVAENLGRHGDCVVGSGCAKEWNSSKA